MAARGMNGRVTRPLSAGTWRCCSGRRSTIARGTQGRIALAAQDAGHTQLLRCLRANSCPWEKRVCENDAFAHGCALASSRRLMKRSRKCPKLADFKHALDLKPSLQYDSLLTPPYTTSSLMRDAGD